jgi:hypothetical protein
MIAFKDMPDQETPGAIHGGSHWQPRMPNVEDYAQIVAADVNDAWDPPAPAVLQAIARWSRHSNHSPDTSCRSLARAVAERFAIPESAMRIGTGVKRSRLDAGDGFETNPQTMLAAAGKRRA